MPRRFIIDLCGHRCACLLCRFGALLIPELLEARAIASKPPGWAATIVKAFALVAKDEPVLRTLYAKWPWPHFFEMPRSVAMVAIARVEDGQDCILPEKVTAPEEMSLTAIDTRSGGPRMRRSKRWRPSGEYRGRRGNRCRCAAWAGQSP